MGAFGIVGALVRPMTQSLREGREDFINLKHVLQRLLKTAAERSKQGRVYNHPEVYESNIVCCFRRSYSIYSRMAVGLWHEVGLSTTYSGSTT